MGIFNVTAPDGQTYPVTAATESEAIEKLKSERSDRSLLDYGEDVVRSVAEGATFGGSQEAAAALQGGDYEQNLEAQEARDDEINPALRIGGNIVGGIGTTLALAPALPVLGALLGARAVQAFTAMPQSAKFGLLGTVEGGLFGAGESKPGERMKGAAKGAGIGAVTGIAAPHVVQGISNVFNRAKQFGPRTKAAKDLERAVMRDEMTPTDIDNRVAQLQQDRPGVATIADAGGENVQGLVERVAQTPGAGRTRVVPAFERRQRQQYDRTAHDLRSLTGTQRSAREALEETIDARRAASGPLYRQAYEEGDDAIMSPVIERLMSQAPDFSKAMKRAITSGQNRAARDGFGNFNSKWGFQDTTGEVWLKSNRENVRQYANLQYWDYVKRELDDMAGRAARSGAMNKADNLRGFARLLREELDEVVPMYKQARDTWSGGARYIDAVNEGRTILNKNISSDEMIANFNAMPRVEREAYREGALSSIIARMENETANFSDFTKLVRSRAMRQKIAALMPTPEAAASWGRRLEFEINSSELFNRALKNSATARRLAERDAERELMTDLAVEMLSGTGGATLLRRAFQAGPRWLRDTLRSRADSELADMLTDPNNAGNIHHILQRTTPSMVGNVPKAAATTGATAGLVGGS